MTDHLGDDHSGTDLGTGPDLADRVDEGVRSVLRDVFGPSVEPIGEHTSKDTVDGWDSLQHLTLVLSLEEEFGVHFDDEESVALVTYPLIVALVSERLRDARH